MSVAEEETYSIRDLVSDEEWKARVDLAALYRQIAKLGWDDLIFTHISLRVPGPERHFLINPFGLFFNEVTATNLVKIDTQGQKVLESPYSVNPAGFILHSPFQKTRDDAHCVIHLHTEYGNAVAAQRHGLLPLSQHALTVLGDIAYHDYEGIALEHDECERLLANVGDKNILILRNHGTLTMGSTPASAYLRMYYLERACKVQILAQAGGELLIPNRGVRTKVGRQAGAVFADSAGDWIWPSILKELDALDPSYRD